MLNRLFAFLLLLNLVVLLSPRDLWHDCDHSASHDQHDPYTQKLTQKDCFACDMELGVCSGHQSPLFIADRTIPFDQFIINVTSIVESAVLLQSLRGPPTVA